MRRAADGGDRIAAMESERESLYVIKRGVVYELSPQPQGGFFIVVPALPGCTSFGDTIDEALEMVEEAIQLWIEFAREKGLSIPAPFDLRQAS